MPAFPPLPIHPVAHLPWLDSIQGNIVKGHGREFTRLLFFKFLKRTTKNLELLPAAVAAKLVTSAGDQQRQTDSGDRNLPFFSVALTEEFFWSCRFSEAFPDNGTFRRGMAASLPDRVIQWDPLFSSKTHGMWLLAHAKQPALGQMEKDIVKLLSQHDAVRVDPAQNGRRWSDDEAGKLVREPFGFRDGISQMDFFAPADATHVRARIGLENVLIQAGSHAGGAYLVLRKLDQNVQAFCAFAKKIKDTVPLAAEDGGALMIGRERDGRPLVPNAVGATNDFDFVADEAAAKCPFHAHIRKANPRTDDPLTPDAPHTDTLFVRRSVVYDERNQLPLRSAANYPGRDDITGDVGLLFMGYMSNIQQQFERMNLQWFDSPTFPRIEAGMPDPIVHGPNALANDWQWNGAKVNGLTSFVKSRGGAYLYVPAMSWLRKPIA